MKLKRTLALFVSLIFLISTAVFAGSINENNPPSDNSTRMYTLTTIYNRLHSGTAASKGSGFTEPSTGPASTMYTLNTLMDDFNTDATATAGTLASEVLAGNTFFATSGTTRGTDWGPVAGTMTDREGDNASTAQAAAGGVNYFTSPAGYYDGDDRVSATDAQVAALDTDLVPGNVKDGVTIFGVLGTYSGGGGSYGVPKTGQTTSYVDYDDGYYEKGTPTSGSRFMDNGDGTITDNGTGLMWAKDGNGAGCNSGGALNWTSAIAWADGLTFAGHSDWRLPNVKELQSIADYGRSVPAIDPVFTKTQSGYYWSSTTRADYTGSAWLVNFNYGYVATGGKTSTYYVRAVRGGQ